MSNENLTTYLKDHHAGSVAALELVDHLIETFEGKSLEQFFKNLRKEIDADQERLEKLIKKSRREGERRPKNWSMDGGEVRPGESSNKSFREGSDGVT